MLVLPVILATLGTLPAEDAPRLAFRDAPQEAGQRSRTFILTYRAIVKAIPEGAKTLDLWLPLPQSDRNQTIHQLTIDAPGPLTIGRESRFGNQCLHMRVHRPQGPVSATLIIDATRKENGGAIEPLSDADRARYLRPEPLVPLDGPIRALAVEATKQSRTDAEKARAIYDQVTGMMGATTRAARAGGVATRCSPAMRSEATAPTSTP